MTTIDNVDEHLSEPTVGDGLRELADLFDEHPELAPNVVKLHRFAYSAEDWQRLLGLLGTFTKGTDNSFLNAERHFSGGVCLQVTILKEETCERRQVGTRHVEREVYPEHVTPRRELVEEPVYEWICPDTWLAPNEGE